MSKPKDAKGDGAKSLSVTLPSFPKFDEKIDRKKWASDYDRVELEMLRNHLATPDPNAAATNGVPSSITLGLRVLTQLDFDRRVPSADEPTTADKLAEMRQAMSLTKGRGSRKASPSPLSAIGGNSTIGSSISQLSAIHDATNHSSLLPPRAATTEPRRAASRSQQAVDQESPFRQREHRPLSALQSPPRITRALAPSAMSMHDSSVLSSPGSGTDPLFNVGRCARLVDALLDVPTEFNNSLQVTQDGYDLEWLRHCNADKGAPQHLITLETLREESSGGSRSSQFAALNSPRSVLVLLRNGLTVKDLMSKDMSYFQPIGVEEEVATRRYRHHEQRRKQMLQSLRSDYREVRAAVPLQDLVQAYVSIQQQKKHCLSTGVSPSRGARNRSGTSSPARMVATSLDATLDTTGGGLGDVSSSIAAQRNRLAKSSQRNRMLLERQVKTYHIEEQLDLADKRRAEADLKLMERQQKKQEEFANRSAKLAEKLGHVRDQSIQHQLRFVEEMEARRQQLEAKDNARSSTLQQRDEEKREARERHIQLRESRMNRSRQILESQSELIQSHREDKLKKMVERERTLSERRAEEHSQHLEHLKKQAEKRAQAVVRVQQLEEEHQHRAEHRNAHAQEKLQQFQEARRREREQHAEEEAARAEKRRQAARASQDSVRQRAEQLLQKQREQSHNFASTMQAKQEDAFTKRQVDYLTTDDKKFFVTRQSKAKEFSKLLRMVQLVEKAEHTSVMNAERTMLLEAAARDREALRLEKERAKQVLMRYAS